MTGQGRRRHYRIVAGQDPRLLVRIRPKGASKRLERPVRLIDTSAGGVGVELFLNEAGWLSVGNSLDLIFELRGRQSPYTCSGEVLHMAPAQNNPERVALGLSFLDAKAFYKTLDTEGWTIFNRRQADRLLFEIEAGPTLQVLSERVSARAQVENLSSIGLAARFPKNLSERFLEGDGVRLGLELKHDAPALHYHALVRHCSVWSSNLAVGFELLREGNAESGDRGSKLERYLVSLQLARRRGNSKPPA